MNTFLEFKISFSYVELQFVQFEWDVKNRMIKSKKYRILFDHITHSSRTEEVRKEKILFMTF